MKLMTMQLLKRFAQVGRQDNVKDPLVIARFFNPAGAGTWYATEYDPETRTFFGYVSIVERLIKLSLGDIRIAHALSKTQIVSGVLRDWNDEWGSFSLDELQNYRGRFGLGIERDLHFEEQKSSQVINKHL